MRAIILLFLLSAAPAVAGPLVDLPSLFLQHAGKVVIKDNGSTVYRELALGDGVVTRCKGDGFDDCVSIDVNGRGGTTDCALASAARTLLLARSCELGGAARRFMLERAMNELGEHVARNAVPPRDWTDLRDLVMERAQSEPRPACNELDGSARRYLASRLSLEDLAELREMTAAPRLPVGKCLD
jgi:hypothetical protein